LKEVQIQKSGGLVPGVSNNAYDGFGIDLNDTNGRGSDDFFWSGGTNTNNNSSQHHQHQSSALVVDDLTEAVQSRDQEIIKIAQSIEELGSIFKELAVLVIDQGTILDRIDYNMETVVESTKTGIQQLEKAERSQKNARPLRCIICLSTTIFILLVILILKHRPRRGWF
jgi:syntaxin 16